MYWRIGPRYRDRPREDNKRDLARLARSGQPPGLLAFDGGTCVGWCELAPRADLDWLARALSRSGWQLRSSRSGICARAC